MRTRYRQSTPPRVDDVYRGLPIGPGGIGPFLFKDRDPVPSPHGVHPLAALISVIHRGVAALMSKGDRRRQIYLPAQPTRINTQCCP